MGKTSLETLCLSVKFLLCFTCGRMGEVAGKGQGKADTFRNPVMSLLLDPSALCNLPSSFPWTEVCMEVGVAMGMRVPGG